MVAMPTGTPVDTDGSADHPVGANDATLKVPAAFIG